MIKRPKLPIYTEKMRKYPDKDKESGSDEEIELYSTTKSSKKEIPCMEIEVKDGDTLQSIAISYSCSIAELKRLNNIHKENEIFARKRIKVPSKLISLALAEVHSNENGSASNSNQFSKENIPPNSSIDSLVKFVSSPPKTEPEVNEIIFNTKIKSKPSVDVALAEEEPILAEEVCLIPQSDKQRTEIQDPFIRKLNFNCSGADCDISWKVLVFCIVLVILALPLIYVFYVAEHPEYYHHPHNNSLNNS